MIDCLEQPLNAQSIINKTSSIDFMSAAPYSEEHFRKLNVINYGV